MNPGLTSGLGGSEGLEVEEFEIKGVGDWMVRVSQRREGKSLATP